MILIVDIHHLDVEVFLVLEITLRKIVGCLLMARIRGCPTPDEGAD